MSAFDDEMKAIRDANVADKKTQANAAIDQICKTYQSDLKAALAARKGNVTDAEVRYQVVGAVVGSTLSYTPEHLEAYGRLKADATATSQNITVSWDQGNDKDGVFCLNIIVRYRG
ncbi:MAG: hypothetical protein GC134_00185 [Proteobacteria bacterium]|nr:hypothetical protein [Pseudomonadota bacterium]